MANRDTGSVHSQRPDSRGRFGRFGGKYVPETLMFALTELESAFHSVASDEHFQVLFSLSFQFPLPASIFSEPSKRVSPKTDKVSVFNRRSSRRLCGTMWAARVHYTSRRGSRATTRVTAKGLRCI